MCMCNLGEEPPPLPVLQFEVTGAVPLDDFHGAQLLLTFAESPENTQRFEIRWLPVCGAEGSVKKSDTDLVSQVCPLQAIANTECGRLYLRARKPLACPWKAMMTTVSLRSRSSSS